MAKYQGTRLGAIRAYSFAVLIMCALFMSGYDTGIVGSVLQLESFSDSFDFDPSDTKVKSLAVGLQQLGAFVASLGGAIIMDAYGRKWTAVGACVVFCVGVTLQTIPSHALPCFYVGRVVAGLGLGTVYCIAPIYSAEMSPKEIRAKLGACFQWMYTWGIFLSYWVAYGVNKTMPSIDSQWQIPIGLQMLAAAAMALGLLRHPESVRWLMKQGREEEAWQSLVWMRADDGDSVKMEFGEIRMGIIEESRATEGFRKRELLEPANRQRLLIACIMAMNLQLTGSTALAYYGPQVFASIVGSGDRNLLITGLFGAVKVVACSLFILFVAERFERKTIFIVGASLMSACMLIVTVLNKVSPPPSGDNPEVTPSGTAMVAMIFLDIVIYNFSWGPLPHPYITELFPTRIRAIGVGAASAVSWLFNFTFSVAMPYMIDNMHWGTFLFFALTDVWCVVFVYFFLKETRNRSLEEMETIFHSKAAFDVEKARRDALMSKNAVEELEDCPAIGVEDGKAK